MRAAVVLKRLRSERLRATNAARRAGLWPTQDRWLRSGLRQGRVLLFRASCRLLGGPILGRLPFNWVPSVGSISPDPALDSQVEDVVPGAPACTIAFPPAPPGFDGFTRSVSLPATSDFVAIDASVSPRSGLVWLGQRAVLGESYGSLAQLLSWGYAAHDLLSPEAGAVFASDVPVLCVPSAGYFHLVLESLPALLRVLERGGATDLLVWQSAPSYVCDVAALLQAEWGGTIHRAPAPVRAARVRVPGRRPSSGHFDREDLARLRALAGRSAPPDADRLVKQVFVSRAGAARALTNESEAEEELARHGFSVVDPGRLSLVGQMATFQHARMIVGAHGSGLANLAWCAPGAAVIEIIRPERNLDCYARLAHLSELRYRPLLTGTSGEVDLHDLSAAVDEVDRS